MLIHGAIHVQIQVANTAVQGGIHIQGLIHLRTGITEIIWATESDVPTIINGRENLNHTTGPPSRVNSVT